MNRETFDVDDLSDDDFAPEMLVARTVEANLNEEDMDIEEPQPSVPPPSRTIDPPLSSGLIRPPAPPPLRPPPAPPPGGAQFNHGFPPRPPFAGLGRPPLPPPGPPRPPPPGMQSAPLRPLGQHGFNAPTMLNPSGPYSVWRPEPTPSLGGYPGTRPPFPPPAGPRHGEGPAVPATQCPRSRMGRPSRNPSTSTVVVAKLHAHCERQALFDAFRSFLPDIVELQVTPVGLRGFVHFKSVADAVRAFQEMDGKILLGVSDQTGILCDFNDQSRQQHQYSNSAAHGHPPQADEPSASMSSLNMAPESTSQVDAVRCASPIPKSPLLTQTPKDSPRPFSPQRSPSPKSPRVSSMASTSEAEPRPAKSGRRFDVKPAPNALPSGVVPGLRIVSRLPTRVQDAQIRAAVDPPPTRVYQDQHGSWCLLFNTVEDRDRV